jgi:hypothetical protein
MAGFPDSEKGKVNGRKKAERRRKGQSAWQFFRKTVMLNYSTNVLFLEGIRYDIISIRHGMG